GSRPVSLCINPKTAAPIALYDLFTDSETAKARLEELIELDILDSVSDYLEYAELLPMPDDCFYLSQDSLTVYYDDEHYRTFSGECGAVSFAWFEIADLLDPDGPAGSLIPAEPDLDAIRAAVQEGSFGTVFPVRLSERLGDVLEAYPKLGDPDYTRNSKLYLPEAAQLRGYGVEIPKYAFTEDDETPLSAIRASRIDFYGLRTGWTGKDDITALLGEPAAIVAYDAQKAEDMSMAEGESLVYRFGDFILEVHLDEEALLSMLILRTEMPE
ncbi:MAG: hypothetical protein IJ242_15295, partial [Clostridia bacterium]|nr:hypothetical protein [Clostridia bacterium]